MTPFRLHQLRTSVITGGGVTAFAPALSGFRVKVYSIAITAGGVFEDSDGTDVSGVMPATALSTNQPDFLLVGPDDKGLSFNGAGTGFVTWAYEKYVHPTADSLR
jgi:hypothetical protein